ncbi:methylmalonyl Co-A mutase-associated GTPase MeaB [Fulvivirga sp. 1062]|uniref:Methylmalonyl Co-A mutase-associated GTPase MeaB n=2 Tax=Fulvivirga sedimenti TaxID=2879465 RepID=A0A9X1HPU9_9BACT|nr:methylmalonyl Co-A mutase-associated GTPase MeaB [Fulvivirga sedimenti]MCA6074129.1 methylmalonyl Co-A mutase-associated GTPase MeaB [Fulvivirga sedimenti]
MPAKFSRLSADDYFNGIRAGDRMILSRAITLVESTLLTDKAISDDLLERILPFTGQARRIGITGVPGVGKSTFIERFGQLLVREGEKLAILTIDPTSSKSHGSILGDKTRMDVLSKLEEVYIRPSAAGSALGGVANATREAMLLCEAAGFTTILIETVGVGQSETSVRNMVDFFLLLMLAGAGDELQGIKKGIMEMADAIAITKSDGANIQESEKARISYQNALHLFPPDESGWITEVLTTSALDGAGFEEIIGVINRYYEHMESSGRLSALRNHQKIQWLNDLIDYLQRRQFLATPGMKEALKLQEQAVLKGTTSPYKAARTLVELAWNV